MAPWGGPKHWTIAAALAALAFCAPAPASAQAISAAPAANVIPAPASVSTTPGAPLVIADGAPILAAPRDRAAADELAALARASRGLELALKGGRGKPIRFVHARKGPPESYVLTVGADGARIEAADGAGLFYGAVTLWQLMTAETGKGPVALPPMTIHDGPRFRWRGLMLDSARHFQTPAEIRRLIDWMAVHKLNVLHWHLTDDQGWRLQILKYPRLTEVGGWRTPPEGSPDYAPDAATGRSKPYGGVYTQAEAKEIVAYAAARQILVVPEIEMPGHALSALLAYPRFGVGAAPRAADQTKWGGFPYVFGVDDATFGFLEDVLTEVMAIFPSPYIHVGGDEAQAERWNGSVDVEVKMRDLGAADPPALQAAFTRRIAEFLKAHGRRLVGWDEILNGGGLPNEAVVMSWHGVAGAATAAAAGHDAILAPAPTLYFDNWQAAQADQPPGRGYLVPLKDVYAFEPLPPGADAASASHILGLEAALWTEHIRTFDQLQAMAFPRAAALAEVGWSPPERRDWASFVGRLPAEMERYKALGLGADAAALGVDIQIDGGTVDWIRMSSPAGLGEIRYTNDGSDPTRTSSLYYGTPVGLPAAKVVKAALFVGGQRIGPIATRALEPRLDRLRKSQELKLCNDKLALNLEGAGGKTYLTNPQDPCWIYPAVDLAGVRRIEISFTRLPFLFALDPAHNTAVVRPPRAPGGEVEVRQDTCLSDPIAVAPLPPPGGPTTVTLPIPFRLGSHDLCVVFTSGAYDPTLAIDAIQIDPQGYP